jgi:hypothetical protein
MAQASLQVNLQQALPRRLRASCLERVTQFLWSHSDLLHAQNAEVACVLLELLKACMDRDGV